MLAWRQTTIAVLACSPAALFAAGFAATEARSAGESDRAPNREFQLAQATPQPGGGEAGNAPAAAPAETTGADEATDDPAAAGAEDEGPVEFTEAFLKDPAHQKLGEEIWVTCGGCHGTRAYPGKGPKLRPKKYTPEFVYDRVTNGYKKMPAWKDVFTKEERMAVTAYVLGDNFKP